jgi:hypothetical protein
MEHLKSQEYNIPEETIDPIVVIQKRRQFRRSIRGIAERITHRYVQHHNLPEVIEPGLTHLQTNSFIRAYNRFLRKTYA